MYAVSKKGGKIYTILFSFIRDVRNLNFKIHASCFSGYENPDRPYEKTVRINDEDRNSVKEETKENYSDA